MPPLLLQLLLKLQLPSAMEEKAAVTSCSAQLPGILLKTEPHCPRCLFKGPSPASLSDPRLVIPGMFSQINYLLRVCFEGIPTQAQKKDSCGDSCLACCFFSILLYFIFMYLWGEHRPGHIGEVQRTTCRSWFSFHHRAPGTELKLPG